MTLWKCDISAYAPKQMRGLFFSSLFPHKNDPVRGIYNFEQISHLRQWCEVVVCAPIGWFPFRSLWNPRYSQIPFYEQRAGLEVYHPKARYIPKIARSLYGYFYFLSLFWHVRKLFQQYQFDVIYTNWLYPDAFAGMLFAKVFKVPYVACALGSDVNMYGEFRIRRRMLLEVVKHAYKTFTVSNDLRTKLMSWGASPLGLEVLYDGVDTQCFYPRKKQEAASQLGLNGEKKRILYIGSLQVWKGPHILVEALHKASQTWEDTEVYFIGEGPFASKLDALIRTYGLSKRVKCIGRCAHEEIPFWLNASDLLCLPSFTEGVPNVILEAWACGIPCVASNVGGVGEIMKDSRLGVCVPSGDVPALQDALETVLSGTWDRTFIRAYAEQFCWDKNAERLFRVLSEACDTYSTS